MIIQLDTSLLFWKSFLDSEGFCSSEMDTAKDFDVIFLRNLKSDSASSIFSHSQTQKRVVITSKENFDSISGRYENTDVISTNFSCKNYSITDSSQTIDIRILREGSVSYIFYDKNLEFSFSDSRQSVKRISLNHSGSKWCSETLCYTDKRNVKKYMKKILRLSSIELNKPLIYLWKYPESYKNIFNLRIDVDPDRNVKESIALLRINNTTHQSYDYMDRITMALNYYRRSPDYKSFSESFLGGFDIANHNFFHCHFPDKFHSKKNIHYSFELLKQTFGKVYGFISPEYFWYNSLAKIIEKYKYKYASSLGFDYSNYPYKPVISNKIRNYFEIPSQPLVYGKFQQYYGHDHEKIVSSYQKMIHALLSQSDEPCLVYEHPAILGQYPEILNTILECGDNPEVLPITLTELYQWVKFRNTVLNGLSLMSLDGVRINKNSNLDIKDTNRVSVAIEFPLNDTIKFFSLKDLLKGEVDLNDPLNEFSIAKDSSLFGSTLSYDEEKIIDIFTSRRHLIKIYNSYFLFYKHKLKKILLNI